MPLFVYVDFHFIVIIITGTLDKTLFIAIQTKYTVKLFDGLPKCIRSLKNKWNNVMNQVMRIPVNRLAPVLKTIINVSYHILVAGLTLMALFKTEPSE